VSGWKCSSGFVLSRQHEHVLRGRGFHPTSFAGSARRRAGSIAGLNPKQMGVAIGLRGQRRRVDAALRHRGKAFMPQTRAPG
jgi:hypothetical protein